MTHLIDKDALVAEMRKIWDYADEHWDVEYVTGARRFSDKLEDAINTLEVKEVDLEKEIEKYCRKYYNCNYPDQIQSGKCSEVMPHIVEAARRFFELGLKAKQG